MSTTQNTEKERSVPTANPEFFEVEKYVKKILELPTASEVSENHHDKKRGVYASFHFNLVPGDIEFKYSAILSLYTDGSATLEVRPPFSRKKVRREVDKSELFDFSASPLSFINETETVFDKIKRRDFDSHFKVYSILREYYKWYRDEILSKLSFDELRKFTHKKRNEFDRFSLQLAP